NLSAAPPITCAVPPIALLAIAFSVGIAAREAVALAAPVAALPALAAVAARAATPAPPVAPDGLLDGAPWDVTARVVDAPERAGGSTHALVALERVARRGRRRLPP